MAGNTATLKINIDVDGKDNAVLRETERAIAAADSGAIHASESFSKLAAKHAEIDKLRGEISKSAAEIRKLEKSGSDTSARIAELGQKRAALSVLHGEVAILSREMRKAQGEAAELGEHVEQIDKKTGSLSVSSSRLGAVLAGVFSVRSAVAVIGLADEMSTLDGRIALATSSVEEHRAVQQALYAQSQLTGTDIKANTAFYARLESSLKSLNLTSSARLGVQDLLNKSMILSGVTSSEASSILLQFSQAMSKGKLDGDEFKSMVENNTVFTEKLTTALGVNKGELLAMSEAGALTVDTLLSKFPAMAGEIDAAFEEMPVSVGRAKQELENAFAVIIADGNEASDGTGRIATGISNLAVTVEQNAPAIQSVFEGVVSLADVAVRSVSGVTSVMYTLASGATSVYATLADFRSWITGIQGDAEAARLYAEEAMAAHASAIDLAGKAAENWGQATQSAEEARAAQEWHRAELAASAAEVEKLAASESKLAAEREAGANALAQANDAAKQAGADAVQLLSSADAGAAQYRETIKQIGGVWQQAPTAAQAAVDAMSTSLGSLADESGVIETTWTLIDGVWRETLMDGKTMIEDVAVTMQYADEQAQAWGQSVDDAAKKTLAAAGIIKEMSAGLADAAGGAVEFDAAVGKIAGKQASLRAVEAEIKRIREALKKDEGNEGLARQLVVAEAAQKRLTAEVREFEKELEGTEKKADKAAKAVAKVPAAGKAASDSVRELAAANKDLAAAVKEVEAAAAPASPLAGWVGTHTGGSVKPLDKMSDEELAAYNQLQQQKYDALMSQAARYKVPEFMLPVESVGETEQQRRNRVYDGYRSGLNETEQELARRRMAASRSGEEVPDALKFGSLGAATLDKVAAAISGMKPAQIVNNISISPLRKIDSQELDQIEVELKRRGGFGTARAA